MSPETTAVKLPHAPDVPGLTFRLLRDDRDYEALASLLRAAHRVDGVDWMPDARALRVDYENIADFDPRRDVVLGEVDGRVVAFGGQSHERCDDTTVYRARGEVHPGSASRR